MAAIDYAFRQVDAAYPGEGGAGRRHDAADLSRPILSAIWRTPNLSRFLNSSIRMRSSADRWE